MHRETPGDAHSAAGGRCQDSGAVSLHQRYASHRPTDHDVCRRHRRAFRYRGAKICGNNRVGRHNLVPTHAVICTRRLPQRPS
jgi:hypothetical protein